MTIIPAAEVPLPSSLLKNIFSGGMETSWGARIERKLQEQYLAVQLEKNSRFKQRRNKKTIITNYLNTILTWAAIIPWG